jgi:predicted anti-sigma-YlaC factor YlaD
MTHHAALGCDQARLALSARLDGEPSGVPANQLQTHLNICDACRDWLTDAERLTRLVRAQPPQVPDLTEAILTTIATDPAARVTPAGSRTAGAAKKTARLAGVTQRAVQGAVAVIAGMQLALALPAMLGGDIHANREMGSLDAAVAVGFLIAAFKPRLARAYTPIAVVLAGCLALTSGWDVAHHHVTLVHELTGHLATVAQAVLLCTLAWLTSRRSAPPPAHLNAARA